MLCFNWAKGTKCCQILKVNLCKEKDAKRVFLGMVGDGCWNVWSPWWDVTHTKKKKNTRREYQLIMTVSLFLTGRHGQPQNNREGPETGRGLWVPRTPLCQRNPVQTSKSLTQRRTYTSLISDTHYTSVQIWLEVEFILLARYFFI